MEYKISKFMEEDYLKILKLLCSDIFQTRMVKCLLLILLLLLGGLILIQTYFFLYVLDATQFVAYGPMYFGMLYCLTANATLLTNGDLVANIKTETILWSIDSADKKTSTRIKKEAKIITLSTIATLTLAIIASFACMIPSALDESMAFPYKLSRDYFPSFHDFVSKIIRLTFPLYAYISLVHAHQTIYYYQHIKHQILLLHFYLKHLSDCNNKIKKSDLINDQNYQKGIFEKMKFCINRGQELGRLGVMKQEQMSHLLICFFICACVLLISLVFFVTTYYDWIFSNTLLLIRFSLILVAAVGAFVSVFSSGQSLENITDEISVLCYNMKWYDFNDGNKRIFLIFFFNTMRSFKVRFMRSSINNETVLSILAKTYSVSSVIIKLIKF